MLITSLIAIRAFDLSFMIFKPYVAFSELGGWSSDTTIDTLASEDTLKGQWSSFFPAPK